MRVLVTGHKGYIGTVLVPMLQQAGHEVVGLDSDLFANCTYGSGIVEIPEIHKDIRDVALEDVQGFDDEHGGSGQMRVVTRGAIAPHGDDRTRA